ncbi:uncharacterized protein LOC112090839 [Morus notabilis]|uniref:uncharacterized protein LOC112090839 n=1 Tax=Morus notabilis TaxID=981085 RepID=UPI000CED6F32|nr:uncharacterized protein LOC112090839 [Morus notabilis]
MARGSSGAHVGNPVVEGMILISHSFARVLFDTGAMHSLISTSFVKILGLKPENLETSMFMNSPLGCVEVTSICRSCVITIASEKLRADLIILPVKLFDIVLGMDWLSRYGVIVDCHRMRVTMTTDSGTIVTYQGEGESDIIGESVEVPVVDEYTIAFPDELPGLPPNREIEFCIDFLPETALISIAPYRMLPAELKELKKQLDELAEKEFIRNNTSP